MTTISDEEWASRIRRNVMDTIMLWASKTKQLDYQKNVPIADVSAELFCQWADDHYHPNSTHFNMAFNEREKEILSEFDNILNNVSERTPTDLPYIADFVKTNEWLIVNQAALETLNKINNTKKI